VYSVFPLAFSVPNRPGRLPTAPKGRGQLSIIHPGQPKGRTAVFGQDGGPYRVRHVGSGHGGWTAGHGRGLLETTRNGGGRGGDC